MAQQTIENLLLETGALLRGNGRAVIRPRALTLDPRGARAVTHALIALAARQKVSRIGAVADGGIPIAAQAALQSAVTAKDGTPPVHGFYYRSQVKDHGVETNIEGHPPQPGDRVAIVTDLTTTGSSLIEAARTVQDSGASVVFTFAVIEHGEQARRNIEAAGFRFVRQHIALTIPIGVSKMALLNINSLNHCLI